MEIGLSHIGWCQVLGRYEQYFLNASVDVPVISGRFQGGGIKNAKFI
jgi:hypothetical protein